MVMTGSMASAERGTGQGLIPMDDYFADYHLARDRGNDTMTNRDEVSEKSGSARNQAMTSLDLHRRGSGAPAF